MILPKHFFDKIEYFEHTTKFKSLAMYDVFTIHFKAWWKPRRTIKIQRQLSEYDAVTDFAIYKVTASAADLYNQLDNWATGTFEEKLSSMKKRST